MSAGFAAPHSRSSPMRAANTIRAFRDNAPRPRTFFSPRRGSRGALSRNFSPQRIAVLEPEVAQGWVIIRPAAERPIVFALAFRNRCVVDAGNAQAHQSV